MMTCSIQVPKSSTGILLLLLLLSGDIETNPGPKDKKGKDKGPSVEDQINDLKTALTEYETKIQGLEEELGSQKTSYEEKLDALEKKLEEATAGDKIAKKDDLAQLMADFEERLKNSEGNTVQRANDFESNVEAMKVEFQERHIQAQDRLATLDRQIQEFRSHSEGTTQGVMADTDNIKVAFREVEQTVKNLKIEATGKLQALSGVTKDQRREYKSKFVDMDIEFQRMKERLETIHLILDDMQEKMYEFEKNKANNLILYGITTKHPETSDSLKNRIANVFRDHLNIRREITIQKATRVHTGPDVHGTRPVLVTFETFKDRETVLKLAKTLSKKAKINVSEDLSKRTREARQELRRFMRQVKRQNPEKTCFLEYDKLYVDHKPYVWNEVLGQVVSATENQRFGGMGDWGMFAGGMSRPGSVMGAGGGGSRLGFYGSLPAFGGPGASRPPSGMSTVPGGQSVGANRTIQSASSVRLPPLSRTTSLATGMAQFMDPREAKMEEMERMLVDYQEKLESVTTNYEDKVHILEKRLVDTEMEQPPDRRRDSGGNADMLDSMDSLVDRNESPSEPFPGYVPQTAPAKTALPPNENRLHGSPTKKMPDAIPEEAESETGVIIDAMIRKAFKKWKKRLIKPKKKSNDDSMDEISNNVNTNELPLEHENQSSDDSSVQLGKTGNENSGNIPSNDLHADNQEAPMAEPESKD